MRDLGGFRQAVRDYRRTTAHTQGQLARAIGLHPDVLSHKLHGSDHAVLTNADVIGIVTTLAEWAALRTRAEAEQLLDLMEVPRHAIPATAWSEPPLAHLVDAPTDSLPPGSARARADQPLDPVPPPAPATPLIGRVAERRLFTAALPTSRLVTLTGPGGTGKTRLAVELAFEHADSFPGGVAFADLAAVPEPGLLPIAVARSLGLRPSSAGTVETDIVRALQDRSLLLVVDNLEHLLDAADLLGRLLSAVPGLQVLATSRIPLRLNGEVVLRVPPLSLEHADGPASSEAAELFVQRAFAAGARFPLEGNDLEAVAAICAALDGLPLAIEMAAARTRLRSPASLLALLSDRLTLLTAGSRDLPRRQQTLTATLDWSHDLLDAGSRELFARLGVFAGPFDARAAAAVYDGQRPADVDMLECLDRLCEHSLLEVSSGATPSFRMLETVREYALARLVETGRQDDVWRRHLDHYLALAASGGARPERAWLDELEAAYPNIRAAFDFARRRTDPDSLAKGLRLAIALVPLWQQRLSLAEGALQLDRLLRAVEGDQADRATHTRALIELAVLECFRGDHRRAVELAGRVLTAGLGADDDAVAARAHRVLGEAALATGDLDTAEAHFREQLAEAERSGVAHDRAAAYNMLGQVARHRGRHAECIGMLHRSLRLFSARPDRDEVAIGAVLHSLGEVARDAGDERRATRLFTAALHRHRRYGAARGLAYDLEGLAAAACLRSEGRVALRYLGAAQVVRERIGAPLPTVEQEILDRLLAPAVAPLAPRERQRALAEGRSRPLALTLEEALAGLDR